MRIVVFLFAVFIICIVSGALLYFVEGERNDGYINTPGGILGNCDAHEHRIRRHSPNHSSR